jgi:hypothetical protein
VNRSNYLEIGPYDILSSIRFDTFSCEDSAHFHSVRQFKMFHLAVIYLRITCYLRLPYGIFEEDIIMEANLHAQFRWLDIRSDI